MFVSPGFRQFGSTILASLRATRSTPLLVSACAGALMIGLPVARGLRLDLLDASLMLRLTMLVTCAGLVFVLDNRALSLTRTLPQSAALTTSIRMSAALAVFTVSWTAQLILAPRLIPTAAGYSTWGMLIEPFGIIALVWAAGTARLGRDDAGDASAVNLPALGLITAVLFLLPDDVALFVALGSPDFEASRLRWLIVLVAGVAILAVMVLRLARGQRSSRRPQTRSEIVPLGSDRGVGSVTGVHDGAVGQVEEPRTD